MRSPKNKFSVEASFDKPLKGLGSVVSLTAPTIEKARYYIERECDRLKTDAYIVIRENKKTYPEFDWVIAEKYNYKHKKYCI